MNLTIGEFFIVVSRVVPILQQEGILDAKGNLINNSAAAWAKVVLDVEAVLKTFITVPADVDRVINALPLVFGLLGVK